MFRFSKRLVVTPRSRGFTLLEVLVAVLVLSIGLLGLAGLQTFSLRSNHSSFLRSQAVVMAYDALDRMRGNRDEALRGSASTYNTGFADSEATVNCSSTCNAAQVAQYDLAAWKDDVARILPAGEGRISIDNSDKATIQVRWSDNRDNVNLVTVTVETLL